MKCKKHTEERGEAAVSLGSSWRGTVLFTVSSNSLVVLEGLRGLLPLSLLRGKQAESQRHWLRSTGGQWQDQVASVRGN